MRAVLFCNEMLGLGHLGISLAVAEALVSEPDDTALIVTGSPAFGGMRLPAGVDILKLPTAPVGADSAWSGTDRQPSAGLVLERERIVDLRTDICRAAVERVEPDVVVVDYRPLGRDRDLVPALEAAKVNGRTVTALGIWDSDDAPEALRGTWTPELMSEVAPLYDLALVYGPPEPDDVRVVALREAGMPVHETDFVSRPPAAVGPSDLEPGYLLAMAGGGVDGFDMLDALLAAIQLRPLEVPVVIVTGPLMPDGDVAGLKAVADGLDVKIYETRPDIRELLAGSQAVVSMAGYCSAAEVLASGKPALMVPRAVPREEQLNRARRLAAAGRTLLLEPADLGAATMRDALDQLLSAEARPATVLTGAADVRRVLTAATAANT